MKKVYRSALRSKKLIRQAFISLLKEKKLEQITVVEISERADISRNTFYAHYYDVYAVLEEYRSEMMQKLIGMLGSEPEEQSKEDYMPHFRQIANYIDENKEDFRVLLETIPDVLVSSDMRDVMLHRASERLSAVKIADKTGFLVFCNVVISGFFSLMNLYLMDKTDLSAEAIVDHIEKIYRTGIIYYK